MGTCCCLSVFAQTPKRKGTPSCMLGSFFEYGLAWDKKQKGSINNFWDFMLYKSTVLCYAMWCGSVVHDVFMGPLSTVVKCYGCQCKALVVEEIETEKGPCFHVTSCLCCRGYCQIPPAVPTGGNPGIACCGCRLITSTIANNPGM